MDLLGSPSEPEFTVVECADAGVKVAIKLDVSSLTSIRGERIKYTVVQSETSLDLATAQADAIRKAFNILENNYMVKVIDFSSRVTSILDKSNTHDLVVEGIGYVENLLIQWDNVAAKSKEVLVDLLSKEFPDRSAPARSHHGNVYRVLTDYLSSTQTALDERAKQVSSDFAYIKADISHHEQRVQQKAQLATSKVSPPYTSLIYPPH